MRTSGRAPLTASHPRDEPSPADGNDDHVDVGAILHELEAERAVACDHVGVVERVDEVRPSRSATSSARANASAGEEASRSTVAP